ncbi:MULTISPECIES: glycosyltransferase [Microbacterium]|uniref:glycosyltransferase n=1 Tax=Microbacterium TaxID=33882 RepID=UPI001D17B5FA|nr:glycosyltransferase [Microbacterium testaceum]MCC4248610.1 glycosyltransferase [Microbacterium testaceum]
MTTSSPRRRRVAIIGTRGYPSFYGGFETAVRVLAPYLAEREWDVTVYGRPGAASAPPEFESDARVTSRITRGFETKSLSTLSYGFTSTLDAVRHRPDVALVMNVANGYWLPLLKARGIPTVVNVDGIEWEREKWGRLAKAVFHTGARATARWGDSLVFDAHAIGDYWTKNFRRGGTFIPYGGDIPEDLPVPPGVESGRYVLVVARFVPENTIGEFFDAVASIAQRHPVVIIGSSGYGGPFDDRAKELAEHNAAVTWLGHVRNDDLLLALWQHCGVYFHGHSVGGTNPALVQAMACGAPVVARDTVFNREVLSPDGAKFVEPRPTDIAQAVNSLLSDPAERARLSAVVTARAAELYSWGLVCSSYEAELDRIRRR